MATKEPRDSTGRKILIDGLREYTDSVTNKIRSGELTRDSDEMATIKEKLQKEESICGAICGSGRVCTQPPTNKKNFRCRIHGGRSTGAKTEEGKDKVKENLAKGRQPIHGIYSKKFLDEWTQEEKDFYHNTLEWYKEKYDLEPLDEVALDRFLVNSIKAMRVDSVGMNYAINLRVSLVDFEGKAIRQAETLGLNRKYRKSKENADNPSNVNVYNSLFDGMDGK
ncbi:HGGxSTG domain-containing protein [Bacillus paramycoides]|uniref:HGGxSTG domain-containing protein n=1 Tax=Bacillus paramycoides TaxID=2026194 RepID=UPI003D032A22